MLPSNSQLISNYLIEYALFVLKFVLIKRVFLFTLVRTVSMFKPAVVSEVPSAKAGMLAVICMHNAGKIRYKTEIIRNEIQRKIDNHLETIFAILTGDGANLVDYNIFISNMLNATEKIIIEALKSEKIEYKNDYENWLLRKNRVMRIIQFPTKNVSLSKSGPSTSSKNQKK